MIGLVFCLGVVGPALSEEKTVVEPELKVAFEEALKKLPEALRERVGDVELMRAKDLGVGDEVSLEYRLLNRAAYASFSVGERKLTVYDAGARNRPTWEGDGPTEQELVGLLAGVADVMGVEAPKDENDPAFAVAWKEFVKRVYSWEGAKVPATTPAIDDREVWNRFLGDGVWRLMGGEVSMEQLMFHEFGHALQLSESMMTKMTYWGELSGITETSQGEVTDGVVGGKQKIEEEMVLIRMLMADDAAKMLRGEAADYAMSKDARFVNRYARYDLGEDYAESFRLMGYEPERLAKVAPEKFLYLNALGWNARLDEKKPGPLWYSGAEFERLIPKEVRKESFERLLGKDGKGLALSPAAMAAILRAHAGELRKDDLPKPYPVIEVPDDLPIWLRESLGNAVLTVVVDGEVYVASPERQRSQQDELIGRWLGNDSFYRGIVKFLGKGTKNLASSYEENVVVLEDATLRANRYEVLRDSGGKGVSAEEWRKFDKAEAKAQHEAGNVWTAARYSILSSGKKREELFEEITDLAKKGEGGFERARFIGTAVDLALAGKDAGVVEAKIKEIPGETLGKWLRVSYLLKAAEAFEGEKGEGFVKAAKSEAVDCHFPKLKRELELMLK